MRIAQPGISFSMAGGDFLDSRMLLAGIQISLREQDLLTMLLKVFLALYESTIGITIRVSKRFCRKFWRLIYGDYTSNLGRCQCWDI